MPKTRLTILFVAIALLALLDAALLVFGWTMLWYEIERAGSRPGLYGAEEALSAARHLAWYSFLPSAVSGGLLILLWEIAQPLLARDSVRKAFNTIDLWFCRLGFITLTSTSIAAFVYELWLALVPPTAAGSSEFFGTDKPTWLLVPCLFIILGAAAWLGLRRKALFSQS